MITILKIDNFGSRQLNTVNVMSNRQFEWTRTAETRNYWRPTFQFEPETFVPLRYRSAYLPRTP